MSNPDGYFHPETEDYKYWTTQEDLKLSDLVRSGKYNFKEIGKLMDRSASSCQSHSKFLGLHNSFIHRKYNHNEDFWSEINPISAYWLGFLLSDASINYYGENSCSLRLAISTLDENHLLLLKNTLKSNSKICHTTRKHQIMKQKNIIISNQVFLQINDSNNWKTHLEYLGLIPNKTKRLRPPVMLPEYLQWCSVIGAIDGDGTICYSQKSNSKMIIKITSSCYNYLNWFQNLVLKIFPFGYRKRTSRIRKCSNAICYEYGINGARGAVLFDFLSKFPVPKLDRKWKQPAVLQYVEETKKKYPHLFINPPFIMPEIQTFKPQYNSLSPTPA